MLTLAEIEGYRSSSVCIASLHSPSVCLCECLFLLQVVGYGMRGRGSGGRGRGGLRGCEEDWGGLEVFSLATITSLIGFSTFHCFLPLCFPPITPFFSIPSRLHTCSSFLLTLFPYYLSLPFPSTHTHTGKHTPLAP